MKGPLINIFNLHIKGSPCELVTNGLDCGLEVSEFEI